MIKIIIILLIFTNTCFANLTVGTVPVAKSSGLGGQLQNGSITDTGTSSGVGNVGIGSSNPGQALDINGTVRALSSGTCTTLYRCVGGVDAGVIQTSACVLCPGGSCTQMNGCF